MGTQNLQLVSEMRAVFWGPCPPTVQFANCLFPPATPPLRALLYPSPPAHPLPTRPHPWASPPRPHLIPHKSQVCSHPGPWRAPSQTSSKLTPSLLSDLLFKCHLLGEASSPHPKLPPCHTPTSFPALLFSSLNTTTVSTIRLILYIFFLLHLLTRI